MGGDPENMQPVCSADRTGSGTSALAFAVCSVPAMGRCAVPGGLLGKGANFPEMKRVLMVIASLRTGGAEAVARDLGLYGKDRFAFDYLVFEEAPGEYEQALTAAGCRIFRMKQPSGNYVNHLRELIRLMKREGYAAVHGHTMFHCGWVMLAGKLAGIPVRIAHAHSELAECGFARRIYEWGMGRLIRGFATDRVACSKGAGRRLFGNAPFLRIPNGIPTEAFAFDPTARRRIREELGWVHCRILGHVGRLNRVKNQTFLLDLLERRLPQDPRIRLLLLGEGEDRPLLEREIARRELEEYVKTPGNMDPVAPWYSAMDGFLFPSLYEGMPLAVLEARCNGLPCLVSDRVSLDGPGIRHLALEDPAGWLAWMDKAEERCPGTVPDIRKMTETIYEIYERSTL